MSTGIQSTTYSLLIREGWRSDKSNTNFTENTPIGGPILMHSPTSEAWVLHSDDRLTPYFCIVDKIDNLQDCIDSSSGKEFQTFNTTFFKLVTGKHYKQGQLGVVIPPDAVLPDNILDDMWLRGRLAGKKRNRVAAKPMFGILSEAIFYGQEYEHNGTLVKSPAWNPSWQIGDNVTKELGVIFREPG